MFRVINDWNNLSENVVDSETMNQFKSRLNEHRKNLYIKYQPTYISRQPVMPADKLLFMYLVRLCETVMLCKKTMHSFKERHYGGKSTIKD